MNLRSAFQLLDGFLTQYQPLLHYRPFRAVQNGQVGHPEQYDDLFNVLAGISTQELDLLESNDGLPDEFLQRLSPDLYGELLAVHAYEQSLKPSEPQRQSKPNDRFFHVGIPGRKWQQILNFAAQAEIKHPILDWCSGKGHLARLLADNFRVPVDCLEFDSDLCKRGAELAHQQSLPVYFHQHDVLEPLPLNLRGQQVHFTALHACGNLHLAVLNTAIVQGVEAITLSPCCYHKIPEEQYSPLSYAAKASRLQLSRDALALCVSETVTGGNRCRRQRQQERLWRLGFDLLQRESGGEDCYRPVPSFPKSILAGTFEDFCHWCCKKKNLEPFPTIDIESVLAGAENTLVTIRKFELILQSFKRPLELWLNLDRCLYLEENGYETDLSIFCERSLTPRNLYINAKRASLPEA